MLLQYCFQGDGQANNVKTQRLWPRLSERNKNRNGGEKIQEKDKIYYRVDGETAEQMSCLIICESAKVCTLQT